MVMNVLVEIFASSPPAICIALGFVLLLFGYGANSGDMVRAGWGFVAIGVLLQAGWLLVMSRRS